MNWNLIPLTATAMAFLAVLPVLGLERPAPPPSRYTFTLEVDPKSLPKGISVKKQGEENDTRLFITNASEVPLVIDERFSNEVLVAGTKLVGGKVYNYFPNGVPMEGKTHLKGWQAPFGDMEQTLLMLPTPPDTIYKGRAAGLGPELPKPEAAVIAAKYDDATYDIKVTIHYHLNPAYDEHYKTKVKEEKPDPNRK